MTLGGTVSADPQHLEAYEGAGAELVAALRARVHALALTAARLPFQAPGAPMLGPLIASVEAHAAAQQRTDSWVGAVARALRSADQGALSYSASMLDLGVAGACGTAGGDVDRLAAVLRDLLVGDPRSVSPNVVAALVAPLSAQELTELAGNHAELVGPVDGFPPWSRYLANRLLIRGALDHTDDPRRATLLAGLLADDPTTHLPHQILLFDPAGDGRIAQVYGDLAAADAVAIFVPGMASDMGNFAERVAVRAAHLFLRSSEYVPDRTIATIAWLGYDAPDGAPSTEVLSPAQAEQGGRLLSTAVAGLGVAPAVRVTLIAHSYGTTVVGAALLRGARADNVLLMGSPGAFVGDAEDVRRSTTDFFTMAAPGDSITWLERYGVNPNEPGSGFARLDSGGSGHSGYLADGSLSQRNALFVIADDDRHLDRRGRNVLEAVFGPLDIARDWSTRPTEWVDDVQRRVHVPLIDGAVDHGIDVAQVTVDLPRQTIDRSIELFEDGANAVTGAARWAWPG